MALGVRSVVFANQGAVTTEGPESHGSMSREKAPFAESRSDGNGLGSGENIRRNVESPLRWRTVTDI